MLRLCLLASKPFTSCDSLNAIIIWGQGPTSAGRQAKPSHPTLFLFVFPTKERRKESGTMMLPWHSHHHGPWPRPASLASPCQGSMLHLAIGNRLFLPGAAIVCFSQTDRLLHFYFLQINEEFPSHGAQLGLTYAPMGQISPCLTTPQAEIQEELLLLCHHCQSIPQHAGPLTVPTYTLTISASSQLPIANNFFSRELLGDDGSRSLKCGAPTEVMGVVLQFVGNISFTFCYSTWTLPRHLHLERGQMRYPQSPTMIY